MDALDFTVEEDFSDGGIDFAALGYGPFWKAGTKRTLSKAVAQRVRMSGGQIVPAEGDEPEYKLVPASPPEHTPDGETIARLREKYAGEPRVRLMAERPFSDGNLSLEFAALDRPAQIGQYEIVELPQSLFDRCYSSGLEYTDDPEAMAQYDNPAFQHRFHVVTQEWQKERQDRMDAKAAEQARKDKHAGTHAEIEQVSARLLLAEGRGNVKSVQQLRQQLNALWQKVNG